MLVLLLASLMGAAPVLSSNSYNMSKEDLDAIARAERQQEDINKQVEELVREQNRITAQQKNVSGDIKRLSNQIAAVEKEIADLDGQIEDKENRIGFLIGEIEVKTDEVSQRSDYLDQRLNQIYRDGDLSLFDVLFASASLSDFLTRYDLLERVAINDVGLLTDLRQVKADLEAQKAELEDIKASLEAEKEERQEKRAELNTQYGEQRQKSRALAADLLLAEEAEEELEATSKEIEKFVKEIQKKYEQAYMGSGTMAWPTPGNTRISSNYGMRNHPIYRTPRFHSGIDIPAPSGALVVAAEKGKVIMATTYGGYGKTVILDHGGGVATQYSHLSSISVKVGDTVEKGKKVGGVGTTGLSTGNHLHFQIMINGSSVNPLTNGKYNVNPR